MVFREGWEGHMNPLIVVISILRGGNENVPSVISSVGRVFGRWGQYGFI
jgi:hypothetical protein